MTTEPFPGADQIFKRFGIQQYIEPRRLLIPPINAVETGKIYHPRKNSFFARFRDEPKIPKAL